MPITVVCDRESLGARIRQALIGSGQECPAGHVIRIDEAVPHLLRARPELVVLATGPNPESALPAVSRLGELMPGHVLAVGPLSEPKTVLRVLRGGAADFIDESEVESELPAAVARLRASHTERVAGRILAVIAPNGGSGASLIAANLAVLLAKTHTRSLLIDMKARSGDLAGLLDVKPSHTLHDLCRNAARIDQVLLEQTLARHGSGAHLLASPREIEPVAPAPADAITRVLGLGRDAFPRVVVDVDPILLAEQVAVLRAADVILFVMRLEFNSLRNAKPLLDHLERKGVDPKRFLLVGNRQGQPKELAAAKIEDVLGRKFFRFIPDDPKAAIRAQNNGVPAVHEAPRSRLAKGLTQLATALDALPEVPAPKGT
jgi:pilus assembly protein CpaE